MSRQRANKVSSEKGYVLLESLVSLSLITIVLVVTLPLTVNLVHKLEKQRIDVEMHRAVYDQSKFWSTDEKNAKEIMSYNTQLSISNTSKGIVVEGEDNQRIQLQIKSVHWFP
ncbi:hypothetical protein VXN63_04480 [Marinilactibacillus sp. XAAS-LB27]|uniref:hypothetical protein n=1 Tax=Marinilactibacillus sp. XAAS-LB27 TaxID=3114538 RepID=UPI002E199AB3|nr:hypothetical protein [Marinilactibacillus sp. XAAS-LB27]